MGAEDLAERGTVPPVTTVTGTSATGPPEVTVVPKVTEASVKELVQAFRDKTQVPIKRKVVSKPKITKDMIEYSLGNLRTRLEEASDKTFFEEMIEEVKGLQKVKKMAEIYLVDGVAGSGKSTLVKEYAGKYKVPILCPTRVLAGDFEHGVTYEKAALDLPMDIVVVFIDEGFLTDPVVVFMVLTKARHVVLTADYLQNHFRSGHKRYDADMAEFHKALKAHTICRLVESFTIAPNVVKVLNPRYGIRTRATKNLEVRVEQLSSRPKPGTIPPAEVSRPV